MSAYSLKNFLASCWALESHLVHTKRSTLSSMSCSEVGTSGFNCGDIEVRLVQLIFRQHLSRKTSQPLMVLFDPLKEGPSIGRLEGLHVGELSQPFAHYLLHSFRERILTSWVDKFCNIMPTLLEPGCQSP